MSTDSLAFSPDGLHFATGGGDGVIRLRETMTGMLVASFAGAGSAVNSLAFFPDGRTLAAGAANNRVAFWDVSTGQERYALQLGHASDVAASLDGLTLIAGGKILRATRTPEATALRNENSVDDPESLANLNTIAYSHWNAGRLPDAAQSFRSAITRSRMLIAKSSGNPDHRRELASAAFSLSGVLHEMGELEQAVQTEQEILKELVGDHPETEEARQEIASHLNTLAWRLVTRLNRKDASVPHAITLARRAVAADPINAAFHNTLGVAHCWAENWKAAQEALMQSMRLSKGGDPVDWLFMAMVCQRQGATETAADWYRIARIHSHHYASDDGQLHKFRTEVRDVVQRPDLDISHPAADEARLRTLITAHPDFASLASLLQDMQNALKRWEHSVADLIARLDLLPHERGWNGIRIRMCRNFARNDPFFEAVEKLRPEDTDLWIARGQVQALDQSWQAAAESYARVIEQRGVTDELSDYACLLLLTGQSEACRTLREKLIEQAGEVNDPWPALMGRR